MSTTSTNTASLTTSRSAAASKSPYSPAQQKQALDSLLEGSTDPAHDARHIYGYNNMDEHELSMLQIITATRILDHQTKNNGATTTGSVTFTGKFNDRNSENVLNLQTVIRNQAPRMALAAEFKRASPSKGLIASPATMHAGEQAVKYAKAGACIISVLTEPRWFQGSLEDMQQVREQTEQLASSTIGGLSQRPAVLRKDFVISKEMIQEALASGADTVLLIVAVLPQHLLQTLIEYARSFKMEPLVEVHTDLELEVAVQAGAKVIGVNNRNLHTFQLDLATSERIAQQLASLTQQQQTQNSSTNGDHEINDASNSSSYTLCALSGMSTADDVHRFRQAGIRMCLIGESLMRSSNPQAAISSLCLDPRDYYYHQQQSTPKDSTNHHHDLTANTTAAAYTDGLQLVKVCGITKAEDALVACRAGVNLIGVIFADRSKRKVSIEQATKVVQAVRAFGERSERLVFSSATTTTVSENGSNTSAAKAATPPLLHLRASSRCLAQATQRRPAVVGVFQNQDSSWIQKVVVECGLDLVQLHGSEGMAAACPQQCGGVPAIRVVDIPVDPPETTSNNMNQEKKASSSNGAVETILQSITSDPFAILLDTSIKTGSGGGTGKSFDWSIAQGVQNAGLPVLVAGGLTPASVADCVIRIRPFGVDVSSGVEQEECPGVKDADKVVKFAQAARQAEEEASKGF